ncbi:sensor histidine kinase [Poseidonibacter lekithochrous]|uniref:sensor histidine kinase n=1 Tax=Poseidonibacter lekithochrous TaxID=1904463 RepID=UPI0008FC7601|nr:sensor histidine kinase [Poseidonibacter lekithochrous]QKJ22792.1 PAS sensor-containing signal transduction histidine kinase [Poseidonibacter lekithochrous]
MKNLYLYLIAFFFFFTTNLNANDNQKVLILHSYNQTYKWTDDINKGIKEVFNTNSSFIDFYVEYMDTKRFVSDEYYDLLKRTYDRKYEKIKFDLIISSDNNAFNFIKKHNNTLFKKTPVVFMGVNYLKPKDIEGFSNFTGINEQANIIKNYQLIKKLHPNIKNIYTIIDDTTTGNIVKKEALEIIKNYSDKSINFEIITKVSFEELKYKVQNLPENSAILLSVYFRTKNNMALEYYEVSEMIEKYSKAPLYGLWDFNLENGIIGGYLTSGYHQGKTAAKMGKQILEGTKISDIPVLYISPNKYIFDNNKLEAFNIESVNLPVDSVIINKKINFFQAYKKEIITLIVVFIFMFIFIILLLINIQKRKTAEAKTKKQLKFQQDLIDSVQAPIYYKNKKGIYTGCNKAFEELLDLRKDQIIGKSVYDMTSKEIADIYYKKDQELFDSGSYQKYEGIFKGRDNSRKNMIFYKNVYYDENNNIDGIIGVMFDITQLKEVSKKLNELNKNLEDEVERRTIELKVTNEELADSNEELQTTIFNLEETQKQLVISEKMASLGGLVAGVAHEINTPVGIGITGITHFIELNKKVNKLYKNEEMTEEEFEHFLDNSLEIATSINTNLIRTAQLVKSFKQISVDQTSEEKREFYVKEYIDETLLSMINVIRKKDVNIQINCDENIKINSFPGAFSQIITNLIFNSFIHGFGDNKNGDITITATLEDNKLKVIYKDTGKGIQEENINKIFDPFFTTNRNNGGTGLGLNIIYNIVTSTLKGSITCKSKVNEGVEFTIITHV